MKLHSCLNDHYPPDIICLLGWLLNGCHQEPYLLFLRSPLTLTPDPGVNTHGLPNPRKLSRSPWPRRDPAQPDTHVELKTTRPPSRTRPGGDGPSLPLITHKQQLPRIPRPSFPTKYTKLAFLHIQNLRNKIIKKGHKAAYMAGRRGGQTSKWPSHKRVNQTAAWNNYL